MEQKTTRTFLSDAELSQLNDADWAWEFIRLNPRYRRDYRLSRARRQTWRKHGSGLPLLRLRRKCPIAAGWGLDVMCDPDVSANHSRIPWSADAAGWSLNAIAARPKSTDMVDIDLRAVSADAGFVTAVPGKQTLYLRQEAVPARIDFRGFSLLFGPIHASFVISGLRDLRQGVSVLQVARRATLGTGELKRRRTGHVTRGRWKRYRLALVMALAGATLRQTAVVLFGAKRTEAEWRNPQSRALKDETRRARASGIGLMQGGYRKLLR